MMALDHVGAVKLLHRHVQRVCCMQAPPSRPYTMWMFALLARVGKPLDPDTASMLRMLLKHLARLRAGLGAAAAVGARTSVGPGAGAGGAAVVTGQGEGTVPDTPAAACVPTSALGAAAAAGSGGDGPGLGSAAELVATATASAVDSALGTNPSSGASEGGSLGDVGPPLLTSEQLEQLACLNILIVLLCRVFGQGETS